MPTRSDATRAHRVELILQQVDALPTLSPIAMRLLRLSASDDADIREIVSLVEADVALTSRLLSLCRRVDKGLGDSITTIDRAVTLLGLDLVRSSLLSVHLYDAMTLQQYADLDAEEQESGARTIDRAGLWRHGVATACAAELIAEAHRKSHPGLRADEAFLCGLLHDLGKYALDVILPKSFARVAEIATRRQANIAEIERTVIGVDHHTAGKRLAEHWGLPHAIQDVIWLHNQPYASLPELPHRLLIGVTTVADALARELHLGWSGNNALTDSRRAAAECGLDPRKIEALAPKLHARVAKRIRDLGLEESSDLDLAFHSVVSANQRLGALNSALHEKWRKCDQYERVLATIASFHDSAPTTRSLVNVFSEVARSASALFGDGFYALVFQTRIGQPWQVCQCSGDGRVLRSQQVEPPAHGSDLAALADTSQLSASS
ncbi:MAG: HDOD domain-containing protein, partial [Planctomycetota bacterium]|nr:HDOD domain-containing protein [Planctomycetota bacterium]